MSVTDRIRVKDVRLLSDNWYTLKTTTFDWLALKWRVADPASRDL